MCTRWDVLVLVLENVVTQEKGRRVRMCRGGLRDKWEKGGRVCGIRQEEDSYIVDSWTRRA